MMGNIAKELEKTQLYYQIMNIWFSQIQKGKSLIPYILRKGYRRVAIYGMAELGERLYYELINGGVEISFVVDQSPYVLGEFNLISPTDRITDVDVVIVTPEYYFDEIVKTLSVDEKTPIIALSTLLGNAFRMNW